MTSVRHTGRMTERRSLIILLIAAALAVAAAFGVFAFSAMTCLGEASDPPPPAWAGCESNGLEAAVLGGPAIGLFVLFAVAGRLVHRRDHGSGLGLMLLPALAVLVSGFALLALL